jgi:hypothetical protein
MNRMKSVHLLTLIVLLAAASPSAQPAGPAITDSESYAVYAAVLRVSSHTAAERSGPIAIQIETLPGLPGCPREEAITDEWRAAVDDYRRQNATTKFVRPGFDLGIPYSLVPLFEVVQGLKDDGWLATDGNRSPGAPQTNAPGWKVFARFPGNHVIVLSAIGFNADRTRAMVAVQQDCIVEANGRAFCHEAHVTGMTKKNGRWDGSGGIGCHMIV